MASPSPYANKLVNNPDGTITYRVAPTCQTASIDLDGDVDIFFDCEAWSLLESEPEDDIQIANGGRISCSICSESKSSMMGTGMSIEMALSMVLEMDMDTDTKMKMPTSNAMKNKTVLLKNELPGNFISGERKLSDYFHQYHFWNHLNIYKDVELEHDNKGGQFIQDSYGVNQADNAGLRKKEIFHSLPTTTTRFFFHRHHSSASLWLHWLPSNKLLFRGSKKLKCLL